MKFKYLFLIFISIFLLGCSSSSETEEAEYPDDADIATLVAETLTQMAVLGREGAGDLGETPQPAQQDPAQEPDGASEESGSSSGGSADEPAPGETSEGEPGGGGASDGDSTEEGTPEGEPAGPDDPTATDLPDPGIPGLDVMDLVNQLDGYGFDCFQPELQDSTYVRECRYETTDYLFLITIWGYDPDRVDLIEAAAFYFGDMDYAELTSAIFELIAKIPYEGAVPEEAGAWVAETMPEILVVGDESAAIFGTVRYYLYTFPSAHVLEIGELR